jgi:hypothetical protein
MGTVGSRLKSIEGDNAFDAFWGKCLKYDDETE